MANDASQVAVAQPKVGGAVFVAPAGTKVPTDATTALDAAFVSMGFITTDGVTIAEERTTSDLGAWGGTVVRSTQDTYKETMTFTPMQMSLEVDRIAYGSDNVAGSSTAYSVYSGPASPGACVVVVETIENDSTRARYVAPRAELTGRGNRTLNGTGPSMPQLTYLLSPDENEYCHHRYVTAV